MEPAGVGEADRVIEYGELVQHGLPGTVGDVGAVVWDAAERAQGSQAGIDLMVAQDPGDLPQVRGEQLG